MSHSELLEIRTSTCLLDFYLGDTIEPTAAEQWGAGVGKQHSRDRACRPFPKYLGWDLPPPLTTCDLEKV